MIETWHTIQYSKDWTNFRNDIFRGLNSLLVFFYWCRGADALNDLLKFLLTSCKAGHRVQVNAAFDNLRDGRVDLLHSLLEVVARENSDTYRNFYAKAYVALVHFISGVEGSYAKHDTILLDLLTDTAARSEVTKTDFENKGYVQVTSLISSAMLENTRSLQVEEGARKKYAEAATFIGTRFIYLLKIGTLTRKQEMEFWCDGPVKGYRLAEYCENIGRYTNMFPRMNLPKYHTDLVDDDDGAPDDAIAYEDDDIPDDDMPDDDNLPPADVSTTVESKSLQGMSVAKMREALTLKGIDASGKKRELQDRLVCSGEYYHPKPPKKKKT